MVIQTLVKVEPPNAFPSSVLHDLFELADDQRLDTSKHLDFGFECFVDEVRIPFVQFLINGMYALQGFFPTILHCFIGRGEVAFLSSLIG
jgi:hypothetical protein